jgi:hypothetical protein
MYYVYCYKDPETGIPFYVGKGKWANQRHLDHLRETVDTTSNRWKYYKISNIVDKGMLPIIEVIAKDLTEVEAYNLEERLIKKYGRRIDESGCLTNICESARPPSPKGKLKSESHRAALSAAHKGKKHSLEHTQKVLDTKRKNGTMVSGMAGKRHSENTKLKISESKRGKKPTPESNEKRSLALRGRIQPTSTCPHCGKVGSVSQMARWHNNNCKVNKNGI